MTRSFFVKILVALTCSFEWLVGAMTFQEALELAFKKYQEGNIQEAYQLTDIITKQSPMYAEAHNFFGILKHESGDRLHSPQSGEPGEGD